MARIIRRATTLAAALVSFLTILAAAQGTSAQYEIGIVYYKNQGIFSPLNKETSVVSGWSNYAARVKGPYAAVRIPVGQPQVFLVCSVDPSRFKLYKFRSESGERSVVVLKVGVMGGGSKTVLAQSEIPVEIQHAENGCFTLTPKTPLADGGEFGFSPDGSSDSFMFGVGAVKKTKQRFSPTD